MILKQLLIKIRNRISNIKLFLGFIGNNFYYGIFFLFVFAHTWCHYLLHKKPSKIYKYFTSFCTNEKYIIPMIYVNVTRMNICKFECSN